MFTVVFQEPAAIAFDFRIFKHVPVAFSYLRSVSSNAGMSFGAVTSRVMSSAYATTAVSVALPFLIPVSVWSKSHSRVLDTRRIATYSTGSLVVPHSVWE